MERIRREKKDEEMDKKGREEQEREEQDRRMLGDHRGVGRDTEEKTFE